MRRLSIAWVMGLVVLLGIDFAVARSFLDSFPSGNVAAIVGWGFFPLLNVQAVAALPVVSRYRVSVRWRSPRQRRPFGPVFAALCAPWGLAACVVALLASDRLIDLLDRAWAPLEGVVLTPGPHSSEEPLWVLVVSVFLGVTLSGPPLALAVVSALLVCRGRLVFTPRTGPRPPDPHEEAARPLADPHRPG